MNLYRLFGLNLVPLLQFVLIPLWGIALAVRHRQSNPRFAAAAISGCALLMLGSFVRAFVLTLAFVKRNEGESQTSIARFLGYSGIVACLVEALGLVLLLVCVFGWRGRDSATKNARQGPIL